MQHLLWPASRLGLFSSVWGLAVGLFSLGPQAWLHRTARLSDGACSLVGACTLGTGAIVITRFGSSMVLWCCLPFYIPAIALLRTGPVAVLTKRAAVEVRGEALGILDACSSTSRAVTPLLSGFLFDRVN